MRTILFLISIVLFFSCGQNPTNKVEDSIPSTPIDLENLLIEKPEPKKPFLEYFKVITVDSFSMAQYEFSNETAYELDSLELDQYISFYDAKKKINHKDFGYWFAFGLDTNNTQYYSLFFYLGSDSEALLQINYSKADSTEISRLFVAEQYNGCAEYGEITTKRVDDYYLQTEVNRYMDEIADSSTFKYRILENGMIDTLK